MNNVRLFEEWGEGHKNWGEGSLGKPKRHTKRVEKDINPDSSHVTIKFTIENGENPRFIETIPEVIEKYLEKNGCYDYGKIEITY